MQQPSSKLWGSSEALILSTRCRSDLPALHLPWLLPRSAWLVIRWLADPHLHKATKTYLTYLQQLTSGLVSGVDGPSGPRGATSGQSLLWVDTRQLRSCAPCALHAPSCSSIVCTWCRTWTGYGGYGLLFERDGTRLASGDGTVTRRASTGRICGKYLALVWRTKVSVLTGRASRA